MANVSVKPPCKYGATCYRKNEQHLKDFSHPGSEEVSVLTLYSYNIAHTTWVSMKWVDS